MASVNIPIISEFDAKGTQKAIKEFQSLEGASAKAQFAIKKAAIPAAAAIAGLAAAMVPAITAASDLEESMSKVSVIFGDGAKAVQDFSKTAAKSMGQSEASVLAAAGTFGTFGKAAGLGGTDLAKFSNKFTTLASDLASFNNTTPEEAINAIGSALRGEAEPMRKFGVLLNDATLKAEAMTLGIYDGSGALTDQQKILAAQSAIFKQTGDAQGDFDRTSDGLANTSRTLTAQMDNLQASIGKGLLPIVEKVLPLVGKFADWAADNPDTFLVIAGAISGIAVAILAVNTAMALNPFSIIAIGIGALVTGLVIAYNKFESFRDVVNIVLNGLMRGFEIFANSWINTVNALITGINLVSPFTDIPKVPTVNLPTIGGGSGFTGTSERAGMPQTGSIIPSMGAITTPTIATPASPMTGGGGGVGGSSRYVGGGNTIDTQGQIGSFFGGVTPEMIQQYTVNVNGGLGSSAEIGTAVVNAIRAFNRQNGPANIAVA
jgi:hypothetical protein